MNTRARDVPTVAGGEEVGKLKPHEIEMHGAFPRHDTAEAVVVDGMRFRRDYECTMRLEYKGYPCSCWECSACGKKHDAPRLNSYCPRCGARIVGEVGA